MKKLKNITKCVFNTELYMNYLNRFGPCLFELVLKFDYSNHSPVKFNKCKYVNIYMNFRFKLDIWT